MGGLFSGGNTGAAVTKLVGIQVSTSILGGAVPIVYGTTRIGHNMIWSANFTAHAQSQSGGKGGGSTTTGYTYTASLMMALCEGPIQKIGTVWQGKTIETLSTAGFTLFNGTYPQTPWGYVSSIYPAQSLDYSGVAYVCASNYSLDSGGSVPSLNYEVFGFNIGINGYDAHPKDITVDFLTNSKYGAGLSSSFIGDLTQYQNYCTANNIFLSMALTSQSSVTDTLDKIMVATNSELVYSEGVIKIIPYGDTAITGNGVTFTPNNTPIYDFTDDDYLNRESPVQLTRTSPADAYNQFQIEYLDRSNYYNTAISMFDDLAAIDLYGLKPSQPIQVHEICDGVTAANLAQMIGKRTLYIRNSYQFDVSWKYILLEPMDIVTITDSGLGLVKVPVRISEIKEGEDGKLTITADEYPFGTLNATLYPHQTNSGYIPPYNQTAGDTNSPMIFEAPDTLVNTNQVWLGTSGGSLWGGCDVYLSYDDVTYSYYGTINTATKQGTITSDAGTLIGINTTISNALMSSIGSAAYNNNANLMYCNGEFLNYQNATLTATNFYTLTPMQRALYNSQLITHTAGDLISLIDTNAVMQIPFTPDQIGQTLYVKLPSFNLFGSARQDISTIAPHTYKISGTSYQSPLPDVTGVNSYYKGNSIYITWDNIVDKRTPIDYEVRFGSTWDQGQILGRYAQTQILPQADGQYWIKGHYLYTPTNLDVYSTNAVDIIIAGQSIPKNVIASFDEYPSWSGILTGMTVVSGNLNLVAENSTGYYEIPLSENIDIGTAQSCNIACKYTANGINPLDLVSLWTLVSTRSTISSVVDGGYTVKVQINIAQNDGIFTGWNDFFPADYTGRIFKLRLVATSLNAGTNIVISDFFWSIDVPDRNDSNYNISVSTTGTAITYIRPFQAVPSTQITIINASGGDDVILTAQTASGFTVQVLNGGVGVARHINWLSSGY